MEKIKKASVRLILNEPFWGSILLECNKIPSEMVPTIGVFLDGTIMYNEKYIETLSVEEVQGLLAHAVCHLVLKHLIREEGRDKTKWNIATDLATNSILSANGFVLPEGGFFPREFGLLERKAAEWYYEKINQASAQKVQRIDEHFCESFGGEGEQQEKQESQGQQREQKQQDEKDQGPEEKGKDKGGGKERGKEKEIGKGEGVEGDSEGAEGDKEEEKGRGKGEKIDIKQIIRKWEDVLTRAITTARMQGKLPGGLQEIISDILNPRIPWGSVLRDFLSSCVRGGEDWSRPNRQYVWRNVYLPSSREKRLEVVIAVDTSGSISDEELKSFFSEVNGIIQEVGKYHIWIIQCDSEIQDTLKVEYPEELDVRKVKIKGRGGTDFRPVFRWIRDNELISTPLIYFTDLEGTFPDEEPLFPVLWVGVGEKKEVPFGEMIHL